MAEAEQGKDLDLELEQQKEGLILGIRNAIEANIPEGPMRDKLLAELEATAKDVIDEFKSESPEVRQVRERFTDVLTRMRAINDREGNPMIDDVGVEQWQAFSDRAIKASAEEIKEGRSSNAMSNLGRNFMRDVGTRLDPAGDSQFLDEKLWQDILGFLKDHCNLEVVYPKYGERFNSRTSNIVGTKSNVRDYRTGYTLNDGEVTRVKMPGFKTADTNELFEKAEIEVAM